MVLGDNIFYGNGFSRLLKQAVTNADKGRATVFGYYGYFRYESELKERARIIYEGT